MKKIPVDLYHCEVLAFDNYNDLKRYCKRTSAVIPESQHSDVELESVGDISGGMAGVFVYPDNSSDLFLAVDIPQYTKEGVLDKVDALDAIMHESVHTAFFILDGVGVEVTADNHETLTYSSTYLFRQFLEKFKILEKA